METINANIAKLREERGWSRRELSAAMQEHGCEIGETALRRIESGQREVRLTEALSFAEVFDIPLDTIARVQPDKYQSRLAFALGKVGAGQSGTIFGVYELVYALKCLEADLNYVRAESPDNLPPNIGKAEAVLKNSERYISQFEAPFIALVTLAKEVGISAYDELPLKFDDIKVPTNRNGHQAIIDLEDYDDGEG